MVAIQFRMARAALGLTVRQLADKAGVHKNTVMRIEAGLASHGPTIAAVQRTLEEAGLVFIYAEEGVGGPGVRLKWGVPEPLLAGALGVQTGATGEGLDGCAWEHDLDAPQDIDKPSPITDNMRDEMREYLRTTDISPLGRAVLKKDFRL
jgi:transcriptional regulator with XRE-family HTH domain